MHTQVSIEELQCQPFCLPMDLGAAHTLCILAHKLAFTPTGVQTEPKTKWPRLPGNIFNYASGIFCPYHSALFAADTTVTHCANFGFQYTLYT